MRRAVTATGPEVRPRAEEDDEGAMARSADGAACLRLCVSVWWCVSVMSS